MKFLHRFSLVWLSLTFFSACGKLEAQLETRPSQSRTHVSNPRSVGGGQNVLLHLPFPSGTVRLCTQGAKGDFSHQAPFTCQDLDFDTSNSVREELFAPASGKAYVHDAVLTGSPFGTHMNIDLGNGTYVVIAHLDKPLVCDGCEVSLGQLIAIEGCTGTCTGDHVHIGLHQGDATLSAEHGVSIEATYFVDGESLSSSEFVCGTGSAEDDPLGESYTSVLPVVQFHPDGTLVITDHNPKVYLLENGKRRWILNEQVFWSHGYDFSELVIISDDELNCYPEGEMIAQMGLVDAVVDPSGALWLVVGTQSDLNRYRLQVSNFGWQGVLDSWGLSYTSLNPPSVVSSNHPYLTQWNSKAGTVRFRTGSLIKEASNSAVYVASSNMAMPIKNWATYLMLGFLTRSIILVEDGVVFSVQSQVGNCQLSLNCLDMETVGTCGSGLFGPADSKGEGGPISQPSPESSEPSGSAPQPPQESQPEPESEPESNPEQESALTPRLNVSPFCPDGEHACLSDLNMDGFSETLLMADHLWTAVMLTSQPAYVYGNGGCFDGMLTSKDLVTSMDAYYVLDFSSLAVDCTSQLTLVAATGSDGNPPTPDQSNWLWWQGAGFCSKGSTLCNLMDNEMPWEEWLLSVSWHPATGLIPTGNGLTNNSQL